ncbi:flagellum targeting protein kharon1, putative [Trypanosoma equiperdum]|uniref:Flagellum targeting protein kharon1 n=4 Tax=Trypanozoon TaxID=39700 RepID=Q38A80_TRYB2|nr:hypothetical protein, conserved [Trypanosoma brucei gambiense DAL972]XP_823118.1 hypothetical protein, conserved [Trypanosoma brucei brucei TREU927]RHW69915.1 flagellum targeting protein kharon1 [Trypanosoma brucei equiperdum]SCU71299.1 flagellum targeting protein kharon1, putative [Trypanosoma equiperdum]EAN78290.1 hypothetical protein, conserved [Trypanosoma brucei brucei TREU927]CBH16001.1 hypothetical protein, conserved [Trypanosoma brucei gambiense DAL972]|eukprot:XP_011778265.1 hypothetical protein, conserved [Trypanosoma brucei gambiense DAL972]
MSATVAQRPSTAQERILASNCPPPPPPPPGSPSHRQRAAYNNFGSGVSAMFGFQPTGLVTAIENETQGPVVTRRTKYRDTSEIILGPSKPSQIKHGVRRYDGHDDCSVGLALTDTWIRGYADDEEPPAHVVRQRGPKDNLEGNCCRVKTEETKPRKMLAPGNPPPRTTRPPYSVPEYDGNNAEETCPKRLYRHKDSGNIICPEPLPKGTVIDDRPRGTVRSHRNRSNESVDVLNLGQYSSEQLNEVERKLVAGPREFIPPPLPPRQRPIIARVHTPANATHDIFGTGQGVEDIEPVHCKKRGESAPKRSGEFDIFDPTPLPQQPTKGYNPSDLLVYDEPYVSVQEKREKAAREARRNPEKYCPGNVVTSSHKIEKKTESGVVFHSKSQEITAHGGRARGLYAPRGSSISLC